MATAKKVTKKTATKKPAAKKAVSKPKTIVEKTGSFAVIATGGKQYLVRTGDVISVEKMDGTFAAGDTISFDQVLLKDNGTATELGTPMIKGAVVTAEFIEAGRGKKIDVVQYKQKSRYYKKRGHRQPFMKFKITEIK